MEIRIDENEIKSPEDFHRKMKQSLELPDYYGENLDALWDCLTDLVDTPVKIIWSDFETSKKNLGEYADKIVHVFKLAENKVEDFKVEYH
jgi:ribonuclease inhibitor